jgi:hypothetical protein
MDGHSAERARTLLVAVATLALLVLLGTFLVPALMPSPVRHLIGAGARPLGHPPRVAAAGSYTFTAHQPGEPGRPVAYDPCRKIHVSINPRGGPDGGTDMVLNAMDRLHQATGLVFVYDGATTKRPTWKSAVVPRFLGGDVQRVLVTWSDPDEVPQLAGDVEGLGGSAWVSGDFGEMHFVNGQVSLDAAGFRDILSRPGGVATAQAIVFHEFGHVVGLAHVQDPNELMYPSAGRMTDFGPGDLAGLAELGRGHCF